MDDGTSKVGKGEVKEALHGRLKGSIRTGVDKGNILTTADPFRCLLETNPPMNYHRMILLREKWRGVEKGKLERSKIKDNSDQPTLTWSHDVKMYQETPGTWI